jgi:RimJ/RimL family protein N-acetyltransferase
MTASTKTEGGLKTPAAIETERLRLRPPRLGDADEIFARYAQDAEVTRYLTWRPHKSIEPVREFLRSLLALREQGAVLPWVVERRADGRLLGVTDLRLQGFRAEIGYALARDAWGQGFASEAARALVNWALAQPGIYRVWAVCDVDNAASGRVLEKAGMVREGLLRRWSVHPNVSDEPRDCWCYAKVRPSAGASTAPSETSPRRDRAGEAGARTA